MEIVLAFINTYGVTILYAILTGIGSYVGIKIKALLDKYMTNKEKRKVVEDVVKAVEQMYYYLDGAGKLQKAQEGAVELLASKGIDISEFELRMLIEATVSSFNYSFGTGTVLLPDTPEDTPDNNDIGENENATDTGV